MGRNLKQGTIRQQQQDQRNKDGDHKREARNVREDERAFILRHRAGPGGQGTRLSLAVMTRIVVPPGMEMKTSGGRLFEINEAGVADKPRNQSDRD